MLTALLFRTMCLHGPCYPSSSISALELSLCAQPGEQALRFQREKVPLPSEVSVGCEWASLHSHRLPPNCGRV